MNSKKNILILDPDYKNHKKYLGINEVELIFNPKNFNDVVNGLKYEYSFYIDNLSINYKENIDWWVSSVASRNTIQSTSFLNLSYLLYFDALKRDNVKIDLVLCYSKGLKKSLDKLIKNKNYSKTKTYVIKEKGIKNKLRKSIIKHFNHVFRFITESIKLEYYAHQSKPLDKKKYDNDLFLVDVFVLNNSFQKEKFVDRYYADFLKSVKTSNLIYIATLIITKDYKNNFRKLRNSDIPFLIKEDYLRIRDYLWALFHFFRFLRLPKYYYTFNSLPVFNIFQEDALNNLTSDSTFNALLIYRLIKRIKEERIRISLLIDWFENQNVDKALNLSMHKNYPNTKTVGYQAFTVSSNYLCVQPTKIEQRYGIIPDTIAVSGKESVNYIKTINKKLDVILAPAFRFQHIWSNNNNINEEQRIQISLPIMMSESLEILDLLKKVIPKVSVKLKFAIKPHPVSDKNRIEQFLKHNKMEYIPIWDNAFSECLKKTNLLISSTSSVIIETISKGIPVIVIGSQSQITHNPIPSSVDNRIWSLCYCSNEVIEKINYYTSIDNLMKLEFIKIGKDIKENYFEPVNNITVPKFISFLENKLKLN